MEHLCLLVVVALIVVYYLADGTTLNSFSRHTANRVTVSVHHHNCSTACSNIGFPLDPVRHPGHCTCEGADPPATLQSSRVCGGPTRLRQNFITC